MTPSSAIDTPKRGRRRKPLDKAALVIARQTMLYAHDILRNWDAVAAHYGISKAAAHRLANDQTYRPSQTTVDRIRQTPEPKPPAIPVPPCPDCGSVHHARCNGNGGTAVVLAPGERVTTKRGPWQSKAAPEVAAMVRGLQLCLECKAGRVPGMEGNEVQL
jgi:hypothetical protein